MIFSCVSLVLFLWCSVTKASFLLDINSELNPINEQNTNQAFQTDDYSIPKSVLRNMKPGDEDNYKQSMDQMMKWVDQRMSIRNLYLTMRMEKMFDHARKNNQLPSKLARKLDEKSRKTFAKVQILDNFQVPLHKFGVNWLVFIDKKIDLCLVVNCQ